MTDSDIKALNEFYKELLDKSGLGKPLTDYINDPIRVGDLFKPEEKEEDATDN